MSTKFIGDARGGIRDSGSWRKAYPSPPMLFVPQLCFGLTPATRGNFCFQVFLYLFLRLCSCQNMLINCLGFSNGFDGVVDPISSAFLEIRRRARLLSFWLLLLLVGLGNFGGRVDTLQLKRAAGGSRIFVGGHYCCRCRCR